MPLKLNALELGCTVEELWEEPSTKPGMVLISCPSCRSIGRPPHRFPLLVLPEKPNHLRRGVGSLGVRVRAGLAPARPGMPEPVDGPLLRDGATAGIVVGSASIG